MPPNTSSAAPLQVIEAEHRAIMQRIAALEAALARGDRSEVGSLLAFLRVYVVEHFTNEEHAMRVSGFPGYAAHKAEHDRFMRDFLNLEISYEARGNTPGLSERVRSTVSDWLEQHILGLDKLLARWLQEHGVPLAAH